MRMPSARSLRASGMAKPGSISPENPLGTQPVERQPLVAVVPVRTCQTVSKGSPALVAMASASAFAFAVTMVRKLFTSLQRIPEPTGPQWMIVLPMASSNGRTRSTSSGSPPTMNMDSPAMACGGRRPTAASTNVIPAAFTFSASASVTPGKIVLVSMTTIPEWPLSTRPPGPETTSSTCGESNLFDVRRVGEHGDHDVTLLRDFGDAAGGRGAQLKERRDFGLIDVEHRHFEALAQQVARHGCSHHTEPDVADLYHCAVPPPPRLNVVSDLNVLIRNSRFTTYYLRGLVAATELLP